MRVPTKARALVFGTVTLGSGVLAVAAVKAAGAPLATLALLGAAVVLTERIQVPGDGDSLDPATRQSFSFSSGVHIAAIIILGPWAAALVAAFGVLLVDHLRGSQRRYIAYNASVFALAAVAGAYSFELLGGTPGGLDLPADFPAIVALWVTYSGVNTALVSLVVAFESSHSLYPLVRDKLRAELPSAAAEAGLGVALAYFALFEPWAIVALLPLVVAVYQAMARLTLLRRETARALETFANVVDERDPYTYKHSDRVAEYVRSLAERLHLPSSEVVRLRWAGRLHDLGKIAVDAEVLRKPGQLDGEEWAAMRRHPRLSARLLRRFRFAAEEAQAVEYHHERFDGGGYYEIDSRKLPLGAHFLIVADSFDAMTTDRPYRRGLPREQALAEIERKAGTQFHPAVAKAFVAVQRGLDPALVLSSEERDELRRLRRGGRATIRRYVEDRPELLTLGAAVAGLGAFGLGQLELGLAGVAAAAAGLAWRELQHERARRLVASLETALAAHSRRDLLFDAVVSRIARGADVRWGGLVAWQEHNLDGAIEREWGDILERPTETALMSWLVREAEAGDDFLLAAGSELGRQGIHLALPLRRESSLGGFVVLAFARSLPRHVELALRSSVHDLGGALAAPARKVEVPRPRRVAAAS